jgi:hypothetical protein
MNHCLKMRHVRDPKLPAMCEVGEQGHTCGLDATSRCSVYKDLVPCGRSAETTTCHRPKDDMFQGTNL